MEFRGHGEVFTFGNPKAWGVPLVGFLEKKVYTEFLENAIVVDFYSS